MPVLFSNRIRIGPDVLIQEVAGESVILDLKTERYLGLDDVGTQMWKVLMASASIQAAFDTLLAEYDVAASRLEEDLRELLDRLLENVLITIEPGAT